MDLTEVLKTSFDRNLNIAIGDKLTLHVFTYASTKAYGASAYVQTNSSPSAELIIARNRVTPIKQITLPKLELMGCVTGLD